MAASQGPENEEECPRRGHLLSPQATDGTCDSVPTLPEPPVFFRRTPSPENLFPPGISSFKLNCFLLTVTPKGNVCLGDRGLHSDVREAVGQVHAMQQALNVPSFLCPLY